LSSAPEPRRSPTIKIAVVLVVALILVLAHQLGIFQQFADPAGVKQALVQLGPSSTVSGSSSTTLILDVGADTDLGDGKPIGCKGKIDFLFVISAACARGQRERPVEGVAQFPDVAGPRLGRPSRERGAVDAVK